MTIAAKQTRNDCDTIAQVRSLSGTQPFDAVLFQQDNMKGYMMTIEGLIILLPALTFGLVLAWAWYSKRRTERLMDDPSAEKSSLAKDG